MKQFVLLFRMDILSPDKQPTKEQMERYMQQWMEWVNGMQQKGRLAPGGGHFSRQGRVLKPGKLKEEGPYTAEKQSVAGYLIITGKDLDDAEKLASKCPILNGEHTSVEIREVEMAG